MAQKAKLAPVFASEWDLNAQKKLFCQCCVYYQIMNIL